MQFSAFKDLLRGFRHFKPHIHLYGGEPLLHEDFPLFLEASASYGYKPSLTTNGDYLEKHSKVITQSSLSQLNISLNGIIGRYGNFKQNLEEKLKPFLNLNKGKKIINLNYVIESQTLEQIEELVSYLSRDYKKEYFSFLVLQHKSFSSGLKSEDLGLNLGKLKEMLHKLRNMKLKFKLLFSPDIKPEDLSAYYKTGYVFKNRCFVPWLGLSVYPNLDVTPGGGIFGCNHWLGNLAQASVADIWNGQALKDFRYKLIKEGLSNSCNRCCHKQYY